MTARLLPAPGPLRWLALGTLLSRIGTGLLMTVSVLYFHRIVGLSVARSAVSLAALSLLYLLIGTFWQLVAPS